MKDLTVKFLDDWTLIIIIGIFLFYLLYVFVVSIITQYQKLFPHKPQPTNTKEIEALKREIEELKKNQKKPSHSADDTSTPIF